VTDARLAKTVPVAPVIGRLSFLDRFLPVWIIAAMVVGIGLGRAIPSLNTHLNAIQVTSGTSLPIFIGLLVMMYPVLAKVRYDKLGSVTRDRRMLVTSLVLNWVIGPAVMFALAWLLLPDLPTYRTGLIIVGLARCIAMVLIWNDLSGGDREAAAVLVAINSLFQVVAFALLGYFYLKVLPVGSVSAPSACTCQSQDRRDRGHLPRCSPRGGVPHPHLRRTSPGPGVVRDQAAAAPRTVRPLRAALHHRHPLRPPGPHHHVASCRRGRIALPLLGYFAIMWFGSFALGRALGLPTSAPPPSRSPQRATTSSWRSRSP